MKKRKNYFTEPQYIEDVKIEKLVFGGQGIAHKDGRTIFVWNALPDEIVKLRVIKKRKGIIEGVAEGIKNPSKDRIEPIDDHYLSSSPWQMMNLHAEEKYKIEIAKETLEKIGKIKVKNLNIVTNDVQNGYRNKMEFGFFEDDAKKLNLSLFNRGSRYPRAVTSCATAQPTLMKTAFKVLEILKNNNVSRWDLKSLIIRANRQGETLVGLFVTNENFNPKGILKDFKIEEKASDGLLGVHVFYSTPKSPASVITKNLGASGQEFISEQLLDTTLKYGIESFFQINPSVFELTLKKIASVISSTKKFDTDVLDFYSGVGSISIPLRDIVKSSLLVDSNAQAISYAMQNIKNYKLVNFEAKVGEAEKLIGEITNDKILIVDPPRAGLHPKVTQRILDVLPQTVIYLSCNIATQARDIAMLKNHYNIIDAELYNYFPRTPHFESLVILEKKKKFFGLFLF